MKLIEIERKCLSERTSCMIVLLNLVGQEKIDVLSDVRPSVLEMANQFAGRLFDLVIDAVRRREDWPVLRS